MTSEKTLTTAPQQESGMSRNALDTLDQLHGLAIYQNVEWMEEIFGCSLANKYKISALPSELENVIITDAQFQSFPSLFEARENSTKCCRECFANSRELKIGLFPPDIPASPFWPDDRPLLTMHRPLTFGFCDVESQELYVYSNKDESLGRVVTETTCEEECCQCTHWTRSFDAEGRHIHSFKAPTLGENLGAPSLLNRVFTVHIMDGKDEDRELGVIKSIFPGINLRGLFSRNANNFVIVFPSDATKEHKALILGALFLHDFLFFERDGDD